MALPVVSSAPVCHFSEFWHCRWNSFFGFHTVGAILSLLDYLTTSTPFKAESPLLGLLCHLLLLGSLWSKGQAKKTACGECQEIPGLVSTPELTPYVVFTSHFLFEALFFHLQNGPNSCIPGLLGSTHMFMEVGSLKECFGLRTRNLTFCA